MHSGPTTPRAAQPLSLIERPRILERIDAGVEGPLTLVSAPAGWGKTVLVRRWVARHGTEGGAAWLPLRREHGDRRRFWTHLVSALGAARPGLTALAPPPHGALEPFLGSLLERLQELEEPLVLVIDDLPAVSSPATFADLDWLLEAEPGGLRLVAAARSDPSMRLQRMRAAGRLTEIRAADLAFTREEAEELLAGLELGARDLESLWRRTEGWPTGLKLAQLSLERRPDRHGFIAGFAGADAAVSDYLLSEVIAGEPADRLDFLLRTCVTDGLCGGLAEALTGDSAATATLRALEHQGVFMSTVDERPGWYRYHRLFVEVLRGELHRRLPEQEAGLHQRAGRWHAREGDPLEALRHAIAAGDWELVADVLGEHWLSAVVHGRGPAMLALTEAIPVHVQRADAELALAVAGLELDGGDREAADELLVCAYELAGRLPEARRGRFAVTSTAATLYRARLSGDVGEALSAARHVLDERWDRRLAPDVKALTMVNLGIAEFWGESPAAARHLLQQAAGLALECGNDFVLFLAESYAAAADAFGGRLNEAALRARTATELAERRGWTRNAHAAIAYATLGTVQLWLDDLPGAERLAEQAGEALGRSSERLLGAAVAQLRARLLILRGNPVLALEVLHGATAGERLPGFLHVSTVMLQSELHLMLGEPGRARPVLTALSSEGVPEAAIGLARLELAHGRPEAALLALGDFGDEQSEPLLTFARVEAAVVEAIARDALKDQDGALSALERALDLAEPRGFANIVSRYGPPVRSLLRRRIARGTGHRAFAEGVLASLDERAAAERPAAPVLLEPLSERELAVLRFLPTMMSNAEIAAEMFVSVNTVKTHLKHVYRKLDVTDRRDCVQRARELRLLSPGLRGR